VDVTVSSPAGGTPAGPGRAPRHTTEPVVVPGEDERHVEAQLTPEHDLEDEIFK
jgi:hypothetical protein